MKNIASISTLTLILSSGSFAFAQTPAPAAAQPVTAAPVAQTAPPAIAPALPQSAAPAAPAAYPQQPNSAAPAPYTFPQQAVAPQAAAVMPAAAAPIADNGTTGEAPGDHEGFFFGVRTGGGYTSLTVADTNGNEMVFSGGGVSLGLGVGGAVAPNLILQLEANMAVAADPQISYLGRSAETEDTAVVLGGIGPSLTYYFMPANVSLTGAVLASTSLVTVQDETMMESEAGIGGAIRLGKEWTVGKGALGVAGQYQFAFVEDEIDGEDYALRSFNINFTVSTR